MNNTSRLSLPLIAPSQAQKHVTHNEALLTIDTLVALHLEAISVLEPPQSPVPGSSFGVGENAIGAWSGKDGRVAVFEDGNWRFATPVRGWQATVGGSAVPNVHDGSGWRPAYDATFSNLSSLGIGGVADGENAVVMRVRNTLLDSPATGEGIRLKINRADAGDDGTILFQTAYSGRTELRLDENDGFQIKVSGDGINWKTCLGADPTSAAISLPGGIDARSGSVDLVLNGRFLLNQRGTAEGIVAAGDFVCDRWRAGPNGAEWARATDGFELLSGSLVQVIEPGFLGEEPLAGALVRCTAEGMSEGSLTVSLGAQDITLSSQEPRGETLLLSSRP